MTAKTETVRARISPELKQSVQKILDELGLSMTDAINMYFKQIEIYQGLPFEVKILNKETKKAIKDIEQKKNLNYAKNKEDFFHQLEN